jgi:hypothetical protein
MVPHSPWYLEGDISFTYWGTATLKKPIPKPTMVLPMIIVLISGIRVRMFPILLKIQLIINVFRLPYYLRIFPERVLPISPPNGITEFRQLI